MTQERREDYDRRNNLDERILALERRQERFAEYLWGNPEEGRPGIQAEIKQQFEQFQGTLESVKADLETMAQERRDEEMEKRGMKRAIGYTGVTNLLTLVTLVGGIIALFTVFA